MAVEISVDIFGLIVSKLVKPFQSGSGYLIHYLQLTVEFMDHDDKFIYETTDLPDDLILGATGEDLLNKTAFRIGPIFNFHVNAINVQSLKLINEHNTKPRDLDF